MKKPTEKFKAHNLKRSLKVMERLSRLKSSSISEINPYDSEFIDSFMDDSHGCFKVHKYEARIDLASSFSIIENPEDSLIKLFKLANISRIQKIKRFHINHSEIDEMDLAAESVLGLLALEIEHEYKSRGRKINFLGAYPKDRRLRRLVRGIGTIRSLKIGHEYLPKAEERKVNVFEKTSTVISEKSKAGSMSRKELAAKKFVDHVNECLKNVDRKLNPDAIDDLSEYTAEIIDNAEEHSGKNYWSIKGYYDHHDESHICEVVIFNFGKTFADTFTELPKDSYAYSVVKPYLKAHENKGFFNNGWNEKDLYTIAALQGHISSKNEKKTITEDKVQSG